MVADLRIIAEIPDEAIETIVSQLDTRDGVLNSPLLVRLLVSILPDERMATATAAALENLQPEQIPSTLLSLRQWQRMSPKNAEQFPNTALDFLERKLPRLVRHYPALDRYRKGAWLSSSTGSTVTSLEVICDARPVFNERRDAIEGIVPLTMLKIVYDRQDEQTRSLEVHLTEAMLNELVDKAQKAQQKRKVLRESIENWIPHGLVTLSE